MFKYLLASILLLFVIGCSSSTEGEEVDINKGTIKIAVDESLKPLIEAQINSYRAYYPNAVINALYVSEQKAISLLFNDSVSLIATTRDFNKEEMKFVMSKVNYHLPGRMALDGVAVIVNKNYKDSTITIEQLQKLMSDKNAKTKLVFDNGNSSNINYMKEKLGLKQINLDNIFGAGDNQKIIDQIEKSENMIGFIGYNWISDRDDPESNKRRNQIKILAIGSENKKGFFKPSYKTLSNRTYPFDRLIILQTFKRKWGIENGFVRFACSKVGQLVTEKMGLLPYYKIPKEFILNTEPQNKK
jgi:phosphate transport system substrate-binding protein